MIVSCIVLNKEQSVHLHAVMSLTSHIEYTVWLCLKMGPMFGEFTASITSQTLPAEGPCEKLSLYFM
jgi:hypothetical protein